MFPAAARSALPIATAIAGVSFLVAAVARAVVPLPARDTPPATVAVLRAEAWPASCAVGARTTNVSTRSKARR